MRPRLALVPGEPAGVGPELCIRAMHRPHDADIVVFGDRDALSQAADRIGLPVSFADADADEVPAGTIPIINITNAAPDRYSVGSGKQWDVRVDLGWGRKFKKKKQ